MSELLERVMEKRLTRREFLAYSGAAMAAISSIGALIKFLDKDQRPNLGYGSGAYGGRRKGGN